MTQLVDLLENLAARIETDPYGDVPKTFKPLVPNSSQGPVSYAKTVPEPLGKEQIFRDPKGPKIWDKLSVSARLPAGPYEILGKGTRGTAYAMDEQRVLKITNDKSEAVGAALVRDTPDPLGNAQRIESVWQLRGQTTAAFAIVQERLNQMEEDDPWVELSDLWPAWSRSNEYAPIMPQVVTQFFDDSEDAGLVNAEDTSWMAFKAWFTDLAAYLASIELLYHDFWHRNLLMRGDQHVAIDFGYSISEAEEPPNIDVIAKFVVQRQKRQKTQAAEMLDETADRLAGESVVDEDAVALSDYPEGFSLEDLKEMTPPKAAKYAQQHLQKLGKGSSRIALAVDTNKVLKVALNAKGIAQNEVEADVGRHYDCVTQVFDADYSGNTWIEVERARKARADDFKRLTGMTFKQLSEIIWYTHQRRATKYNGTPPPAPAVYDPENPLVACVTDMMVNYDMPAGDLMRPSHWGVVKRMDGEHIVLIDFGLTNKVYDEHYSRFR